MADLFDVAGKTVLVTGGSRGIGRMIASAFVHAGAIVYIASRDETACVTTATELSSDGVCRALPANLSTEAGCRLLTRGLAEYEERLDVLVNNAGAAWGAPIEDYNDDAWDKVLSLNVKGVFHMTRFLLPHLLAASRVDAPARVVNIGSVDGLRVPMFQNYAYSASKAALHHLTRHLAKDLAPRITVNAIAPGLFESKMTAHIMRTHGGALREATPMGRVGSADDIGGATIYLASRAAAFVTGTVLCVDGGMAAAC